VASEQNQHCGGEARPQGLKLKAAGGFLGRGGKPLSRQLGGLGSALSSPTEVWDEALAAKSFGAVWALQMRSPAVLL